MSKIMPFKKGKLNFSYKNGKYCKNKKYYCINCNKQLSTPTVKRCRSCSEKRKNIGRKNGSYKKIGSFRITTSGYKKIKYADNYWRMEHRYKVEKYINRKLRKEEIIHHIDGNKLNNKLNNLYIFPKKGLHSAFEFLLRYNIVSRTTLKSNLKKWKNDKK